jgi:hypothetical protein
MSYANTGSPECGMEIVRFLERKAKKEPEEFKHLRKVKIIVHTWNEHAGPIMVDRLRKIGLSVELKPFGM